ncbi:MAG: hypothetical protein LBB58_06465 [Cellulomonadaceae bacterium]|jgi:hypothetical protein|nr:hypothetical protein [Cellulomonadaceae bacterium]
MADSIQPTARVYIDGLNLYQRLLQGHPQSKWLNIEALADRLFPDYSVISVAYFTANIKILPGKDSSSPQRQQVYLRALATLPRTRIYLGKFRIDKRILPVHPTQLDDEGNPVMAVVKKPEEKGSDVALASRLLIDAVKCPADIYIICTNDSDLVMPLRLVSEELG